VTRKPPQKGSSHTETERIRRERGARPSARSDKAARSTRPEDDWFEDFLTPAEMREWAQREIRDAAKALDLRARELFDLVDAYSSGKITPEKADELHSRYQHRWGDALPGVVQGDIGDPPLTDEHILAKMDERNNSFATPREIHEQSRAARTNLGSGKSR
jgi:hypothetical protein